MYVCDYILLRKEAGTSHFMSEARKDTGDEDKTLKLWPSLPPLQS